MVFEETGEVKAAIFAEFLRLPYLLFADSYTGEC